MDAGQMHDILWRCNKLSLQLWLTPAWVTGEFIVVVLTKNQFTHDAYTLEHFVTKRSIYITM